MEKYLPHQQRVLTERDELDAKLIKLETFLNTPLFDDLDEAEQGRLNRQYQAMLDYSTVLAERIEAFAPKATYEPVNAA